MIHQGKCDGGCSSWFLTSRPRINAFIAHLKRYHDSIRHPHREVAS